MGCRARMEKKMEMTIMSLGFRAWGITSHTRVSPKK